MKYRILLTNDDGIMAPGLTSLYSELSRIADVTVVAPSSEKSAVAHAISVFNEMTLEEHVKDGITWGYGFDGTPADCVKIALTHILKEPPHLVISGINRGQNTGFNILYSGTVAGAMEAAMYGLPAIAVSLAALPPAVPFFDYAAVFAARLALQVIPRGLPRGVLLNVNVPNCLPEQIRGVSITRQGESRFEDFFRHEGHMNGLPLFRNVGGRYLFGEPLEDYDETALAKNVISITPLRYDLTHHELIPTFENWLREGIHDELLSPDEQPDMPPQSSREDQSD
ncbi:MAG TPA: 5'/3'-nucleotidase SurE [Candidatus Sumerlaeota bacterium]|nr:5'/3'-nucleotidase SurE [Candidatus Sumerlaeota bacterium]